ncbi:disease resistance protein RPM1-like [Prunus yedoensis var. nudiflora]|uniref:Disease resistance protein RPM1-like n=1 Tax=Prunus yedoensis var. nudiflora TaxID=2094558 RepID=A0A314YRQ6_PRUYE|nr:disease resistance protein RPM1-like [Prunus yedoensis var. nudiflora]
MHDLLREIALSIAKKEKFCAVHDGSETVEETGALRLSIQTTNGEIGSCTELPESIGQLGNLQTLDIKGTKIEALPRGISKLLNLRIYLRAGSFPERDEEDLCASIQEMKVLSYLSLFVADGEEFLRVDVLSSPPPYLDTLGLVGKLEKGRVMFQQRLCEASGIEHLTKLQGYRFDNVSEKFRESIKKEVWIMQGCYSSTRDVRNIPSSPYRLKILPTSTVLALIENQIIPKLMFIKLHLSLQQWAYVCR